MPLITTVNHFLPLTTTSFTKLWLYFLLFTLSSRLSFPFLAKLLAAMPTAVAISWSEQHISQDISITYLIKNRDTQFNCNYRTEIMTHSQKCYMKLVRRFLLWQMQSSYQNNINKALKRQCDQHGASMDAYGLYRQIKVPDLNNKTATSAGIPAIMEPNGLLRSHGKCVDGLTLILWQEGKPGTSWLSAI